MASGSLDAVSVLVPYKITLLSNIPPDSWEIRKVLVPYKITLLSNFGKGTSVDPGGFSTL